MKTLAFAIDEPDETWSMVHIRTKASKDDRESMQGDQIRSNVRDKVPLQRRSSMTPLSPPSVAASAPVSPKSVDPAEQRESEASKTSSSPSQPFFSSRRSGHASPETSAPVTLPKPAWKRTSSGLSSLSSFLKPKEKSRNKSTRLQVKLLGETPRDQVPLAFRQASKGTHYTTLGETLARYGDDSAGTSSEVELKLAEGQEIGHFVYTPGTVFHAGSGTKLPETVQQASGSNKRGGDRLSQRSPELNQEGAS